VRATAWLTSMDHKDERRDVLGQPHRRDTPFPAETVPDVPSCFESLDHGEQPDEVGIAVARQPVV